MFMSLATRLDDYLAEKTIDIIANHDLSYLRVMQLKVVLRTQILLQKIFPSIRDKYADDDTYIV